jgi:putative transposase
MAKRLSGVTPPRELYVSASIMRLREGRTILTVVSAPARRQQVTYAKARGLSQRRACALMSIARSALHYESTLAVRDAPVLAAMSILSAQYPRYGYRRIQIFLERQGHPMSADRAWRLWRLAGPQVPRKRPRRRVSLHRPLP